MQDNIIAIIPARMASKRLPGKPMIDIEGLPMIGHVYFRTKMCLDISEVYVATCDNEIDEYIKSIGGKSIMTSHENLRSTDRVAEALKIIEKETKKKSEIVVIVQGDEPLVNDQMIANSISALLIDPGVQIANLMTPIADLDEMQDPNSVKVVVDNNNYALYMSRSIIPYENRGVSGLPVLKKVNVMAVQRDFLIHFAALPPSPLELVEDIGMLRILENGMKIKMVFSDTYTVSVDTPLDLEIVRKLMRVDFWKDKYMKKK